MTKLWHADFGRVSTRVGLGAWAIIILSGWSLYKRILRKDPLVLTVAPWLLFVRAWALGLGFLFWYPAVAPQPKRLNPAILILAATQWRLGQFDKVAFKFVRICLKTGPVVSS